MPAAAELMGARSPSDATELVELGRVARPHGLDGTLQIQLHSDDPANLLEARELILRGESSAISFGLKRAKPAAS